MNPGHSAYENYMAGNLDGARQLDDEIAQAERTANRVDGYDRDDLGDSPDY